MGLIIVAFYTLCDNFLIQNRHYTRLIIVDLRINETRQTGAVFNCTYRGRKCLFIFRIHYRIVHSNLDYVNSTRVWEILINL